MAVREPLLLGVDAGTSRVRALVFTLDGEVVGRGEAVAPTHSSRPGRSEQTADGLWTACCTAITSAIADPDIAARVRGLSVASCGEAFVPLDEHGEPTHSVIAWFDDRTVPVADEVARRLGADELFAVTGLTTDPTFSVMKLLWMRDHAAAALARTRVVLPVAHYLTWRLSGEIAADLTLASRTLALDIHRRSWATDLVADLGLDPEILPPLQPLGTLLGSVRRDVAHDLGLPPDCSVAVGGHDHVIGALAVNGLAAGSTIDSLGTAEAITVGLDRTISDPAVGRLGFNQGIGTVGTDGFQYVLGSFLASGASTEWARQLFGPDTAHAELIASAVNVLPGANGVAFVPDLRGKLIPTQDPAARGAWLGLTAETDRSSMYRAVLEGVALEAKQLLDSLGSVTPLPDVASIRAIGGNTRNRLLLEIKASVYETPVEYSVMPEATSFGAALLGGLAAGLFTNFAAAAIRGVGDTAIVQPNPEWFEVYRHRLSEVHVPAYRALREINHRLTSSRPSSTPDG
jgi:xylulokinase